MSNVLAPSLQVLSDDALERLAARAAVAGGADLAENLADLGEAGYLLLAVPVGLGGLGGNLVQVCHQQRRLARWAPGLALAVNEHLCWTGTAAELRRTGNQELDWLLEEAAGGEVFSGGFGGPSEALTPLAWTQTTLAAITTGIAERAFGLGVAGARSAGAEGRRPDLDPRRGAALMAVEVEALVAHAERVTDDWSAGVDHGPAWPAKLAAARWRVADGAERIVDTALGLWAGGHSAPVDELERLRSHLSNVGLAVDDTFDDLIGRWAVDEITSLRG